MDERDIVRIIARAPSSDQAARNAADSDLPDTARIALMVPLGVIRAARSFLKPALP